MIKSRSFRTILGREPEAGSVLNQMYEHSLRIKSKESYDPRFGKTNPSDSLLRHAVSEIKNDNTCPQCNCKSSFINELNGLIDYENPFCNTLSDSKYQLKSKKCLRCGYREVLNDPTEHLNKLRTKTKCLMYGFMLLVSLWPISLFTLLIYKLLGH